MRLNARVGRSGVEVRVTSRLNALPFVLLSGVYQALVKPAVPVGVRGWCCWWG